MAMALAVAPGHSALSPGHPRFNWSSKSASRIVSEKNGRAGRTTDFGRASSARRWLGRPGRESMDLANAPFSGASSKRTDAGHRRGLRPDADGCLGRVANLGRAGPAVIPRTRVVDATEPAGWAARGVSEELPR